MKPLFESTPSWLPVICRPRPLSMGAPDRILKERIKLGLNNKPMLYYIETLRDEKLRKEQQVSVVEILPEICQQNTMVQPLDITNFPPKDFTRLLPPELVTKYYVQAFNYCAPFLSIAVLEPDVIIEFYQEYSIWAKANTMSVLQFFITTPEYWDTYYVSTRC